MNGAKSSPLIVLPVTWSMNFCVTKGKSEGREGKSPLKNNEPISRELMHFSRSARELRSTLLTFVIEALET